MQLASLQLLICRIDEELQEDKENEEVQEEKENVVGKCRDQHTSVTAHTQERVLDEGIAAMAAQVEKTQAGTGGYPADEVKSAVTKNPESRKAIRAALDHIQNVDKEINQKLLQCGGMLSKDKLAEMLGLVKKRQLTAEQVEKHLQDWAVALSGKTCNQLEQTEFSEVNGEFEMRKASVKVLMGRITDAVQKWKVAKASACKDNDAALVEQQQNFKQTELEIDENDL